MRKGALEMLDIIIIIIRWTCVTVSVVFAVNPMEIKYVVDFDPKLGEIMAETKYMEMLGFSVPELARNVALQVSLCFGA